MTRKGSKQQPTLRLAREYERIAARYTLPSPRQELKSVVCSVCGRRRNVPVDTLEKGFICARCREEQDEQTEAARIG